MGLRTSFVVLLKEPFRNVDLANATEDGGSRDGEGEGEGEGGEEGRPSLYDSEEGDVLPCGEEPWAVQGRGHAFEGGE